MREDRGVGRSRWGAIKNVAVSAIVAAMMVGCYNWFAWDAVFDRTAPGGSYYPGSPTTTPPWVGGWNGGDGASSVQLPSSNANRTDRTLWLHGDAFIYKVTLIDQNGTPSGVFGFAPSNTVGVSDRPSGGARGTPPNVMRWYARNSSGTAVDVTGNQNGASAPFFTPTSTSDRLWPGDGIVLDGKLFVFMHEWFHPLQCDQSAVASLVFSVTNPSADPPSWTPIGTPLTRAGVSPLFALNIQWGNALLIDPSDSTRVLIFGVAAVPNVLPNGVFVARATSSTISSYENWQFLKSNGAWATGAPTSLSQLKKIAQVNDATELSIDQITLIDGAGAQRTRFVMTHGEYSAKNIVLQISTSNTDPTKWAMYDPTASSANWWRGSIPNAFDQAVMTQIPRGTCPVLDPPAFNPCNGLPLPPDPTPGVWAEKGAWFLSPQPTATSAPYYVSYYAGVLDFSKDQSDNRRYLSCKNQGGGFFGSLRFTNTVDLMQIRPWCTQTSCWN